MRDIKKHIVHCSASQNFVNLPVSDIRDWHVQNNGWSDIGYHFVIYPSGEIVFGRPLERAGAHCKGQNQDSIGTCLVGDDKFTSEQFKSLKKLHKTFKSLFPEIEPFGHRDFTDKKTCPNFEVRDHI